MFYGLLFHSVCSVSATFAMLVILFSINKFTFKVFLTDNLWIRRPQNTTHAYGGGQCLCQSSAHPEAIVFYQAYLLPLNANSVNLLPHG